MINFEDFLKVELKVGKILEANEHPDADKLCVLKVDLGEKQIQLVAGIKKFYEMQNLVGKNIVVVVNLEPRKLRGVESQGMLLAAKVEDALSLVTTDKEIAPGAAIS